MTEVTADNLNSVMEFDRVIRVAADGTVSDSPLDPYFELHCDEVSEGHWEDNFTIPEGWQLLTGFSGQQSYAGPVMHQSEYIGGGMARYILETPGDYVALVVESYDIHCGDCAEFEYEQSETPAGWAVAFKPATTTETGE